MTASSPIVPGSTIFVGRDDDNDPISGLTAYLVAPTEPIGDPEDPSDWTPIASSVFGGNEGENYEANTRQFLWAMSCLAEFHNLSFQNETGIKP